MQNNSQNINIVQNKIHYTTKYLDSHHYMAKLLLSKSKNVT